MHESAFSFISWRTSRIPIYPLWRAFSKSSVFVVHTTTGKWRFRIYIHSGERFRKAPFSSVFDDRRRRISVDEWPNRIKKYPFSNENGLVWTGAKSFPIIASQPISRRCYTGRLLRSVTTYDMLHRSIFSAHLLR